LGADRFLEESLDHYRKVEDGPGESWVMDWTANIRLDEGHFYEAEKLFQTAFEKAGGAQAGTTPQAWNHFHRGLVHLAKGQREEVRGEMEKAFKLFTELKDPNGLDQTMLHLARIHCLEGQAEKAQPLIRKVLETAFASRLTPVLIEALTVMARYEKAMGRDTQALAFLLMALHHPACRQATKDGVKDFYREIESRFPPDEVEGALRWAKASRLEIVVADWLAAHEAVSAEKNKKPRKKVKRVKSKKVKEKKKGKR
jgi:tetratricopeptide (TPR) repeat protein